MADDIRRTGAARRTRCRRARAAGRFRGRIISPKFQNACYDPDETAGIRAFARAPCMAVAPARPVGRLHLGPDIGFRAAVARRPDVRGARCGALQRRDKCPSRKGNCAARSRERPFGERNRVRCNTRETGATACASGRPDCVFSLIHRPIVISRTKNDPIISAALPTAVGRSVRRAVRQAGQANRLRNTRRITLSFRTKVSVVFSTAADTAGPRKRCSICRSVNPSRACSKSFRPRVLFDCASHAALPV